MHRDLRTKFHLDDLEFPENQKYHAVAICLFSLHLRYAVFRCKNETKQCRVPYHIVESVVVDCLCLPALLPPIMRENVAIARTNYAQNHNTCS